MTGMDIELPITASELARKLGVTPQGVGQWKTVPSDRVIEVSRACDWRVTPHELRPDLYPHPDDGLPEALRGAAPTAKRRPPRRYTRGANSQQQTAEPALTAELAATDAAGRDGGLITDADTAC